MVEQRVVAGLSCGDVLQALSEYFDGTLPAERMRRIEAHLAGCDWCEHFGGRFGAAVAALRRELKEPDTPSDALRTRLRERLRREAGS